MNNCHTFINKTISILIWITIFIVIIIAYAFRFELLKVKDRVIAVILPSYSWINHQGKIIISRNIDGHFYLQAYVNKIPINFLIDTGASDISITQQDAIRLGINVNKLQYSKEYNTANGVVLAAPFIIKRITIGEKTFFNIEAHISQTNSKISLLGMSLIDEFHNVSIRNDSLTLEY